MSRYVASALALLMLVVAPAGAGAKSVEISLHDELSTGRTYYTLAEIATLRSPDAALLERLRALRHRFMQRLLLLGQLPQRLGLPDRTREEDGLIVARAQPDG